MRARSVLLQPLMVVSMITPAVTPANPLPLGRRQ